MPADRAGLVSYGSVDSGMVVVGFALTMVGVALASNIFGLAEAGARFNAVLGGLRVNSAPATWRLTGGILIAVGVPLTLWTEPPPLNFSTAAGRLVFGAIGVVVLHDVLSWSDTWVYNGRFLGWWIRQQSATAQILWRLSMGIIGGFTLLAGFFGVVVSR